MDAPPNILFVLADQLGARWLPTYGNPLVETPHLDKFAAEGAVFERAITTSPVCTPYRGCLLSGKYPTQTGVLENGQAFPGDVDSLADHLNDAGYQTHYVGKWHLSGAPQMNRWVPPESTRGLPTLHRLGEPSCRSSRRPDSGRMTQRKCRQNAGP